MGHKTNGLIVTCIILIRNAANFTLLGLCWVRSCGSFHGNDGGECSDGVVRLSWQTGQRDRGGLAHSHVDGLAHHGHLGGCGQAGWRGHHTGAHHRHTQHAYTGRGVLHSAHGWDDPHWRLGHRANRWGRVYVDCCVRNHVVQRSSTSLWVGKMGQNRTDRWQRYSGCYNSNSGWSHGNAGALGCCWGFQSTWYLLINCLGCCWDARRTWNRLLRPAMLMWWRRFIWFFVWFCANFCKFLARHAFDAPCCQQLPMSCFQVTFVCVASLELHLAIRTFKRCFTCMLSLVFLQMNNVSLLWITIRLNLLVPRKLIWSNFIYAYFKK